MGELGGWMDRTVNSYYCNGLSTDFATEISGNIKLFTCVPVPPFWKAYRFLFHYTMVGK